MTAYEVLEELKMGLGKAKKSEVMYAYRLAGREGTICPEDAAHLFGKSDPSKLRDMSLREALVLLGCVGPARIYNVWVAPVVSQNCEYKQEKKKCLKS